MEFTRTHTLARAHTRGRRRSIAACFQTIQRKGLAAHAGVTCVAARAAATAPRVPGSNGAPWSLNSSWGVGSGVGRLAEALETLRRAQELLAVFSIFRMRDSHTDVQCAWRLIFG